MNKIHILPEHVASRIAAGEVVVRPSSVVKELLENSLDAGASQITIEIAKAGKDLIRITDDGCGMSVHDAPLAFQRHATSKIKSDQDLFKLSTYGFRGEAVPSIASVSMVDLKTCLEGSAEGIHICTEGGESLLVKPAPPVKGTSFELRNLFFNTPARRKFLKNDTTEFNHIMETVVNQSLTALDVAFELIHDGKSVLRLSVVERMEQRLGDIYGHPLEEAVVAIREKNPLVTLKGYISKPHFTRSNRSLQRIFVNGRSVKDKTIAYAIHAAYANVLPSGRHAVCFLFLDLSPESIDVNVHPTKAEVKFKDDSSIRAIVQRTLKEGIDGMSKDETVDLEKVLPLKPISLGRIQEKSKKTHKAILDFHAKTKEPVDYRAMRESNEYGFYEREVSLQEPTVETIVASQREDLLISTDIFEEKIENTKRFYKVKDLFVVTEEEDGLVIVDQHAAQERVMYERFLNHVQNGDKAVQDLLLPLSLDVSVADATLLEALIPAFESLGFVVEPFGDKTYVVKAVPSFVRENEVLNMMNDILDDVREMGYSPQSLMNHFDEVLATMACRASIKAGDKVSDIELSHIFQELKDCNDPNTCPHGRPTMIKFTFDELERKFRRRKG